MKANYEDKIPQATSEVSLGNLYDVNKQLMMQEPVIAEETRTARAKAMVQWMYDQNEKYLMMLCHERRDYTLFNLDRYSMYAVMPESACTEATADVLECLDNRGAILAIELQPDGAWELWIRVDEECYAYYLFPYSTAVLEYGGLE